MTWVRKSVATGMIDDNGWYGCNRKKDEVDEEFYCHILFDKSSK
jgi:hypothetical protein